MNFSSPMLRSIYRNRLIYIMIFPGMLYFVIFKYIPMAGLMIAFKDFQPFLGMWGSKWVGLKHFEYFFTLPDFWMLFSNTLVLACYNLFLFFPLPIMVALMLNEVRQTFFKNTVQSLIYIPHFISWVAVVGMAYLFLTTEDGFVNNLLISMGFKEINFLMSMNWFRPLIVGEVIWKELGWGTIIFLAAIAGVDPSLYEASRMDGAGRFRQMWHVTLPAIASTIVILFILRLGMFLDTGFEQIYLMLNPLNREVGEVFDTYVYENGILQGRFSYTTAVGLFKSVIGFLLVFGANYLAKRFGEEGVY